jgi:hypothetical protein
MHDSVPACWRMQRSCARGWNKGRIGVEMDSFSFTAQAHAQPTSALPHVELVDAQALVSGDRAVIHKPPRSHIASNST